MSLLLAVWISDKPQLACRVVSSANKPLPQRVKLLVGCVEIADLLVSKVTGMVDDCMADSERWWSI